MTSSVDPIHFGHIAYGDIDRDGDMELFAQGNRNTRDEPRAVQRFYRNEGDIAILSPGLPGGPPAVEYLTAMASFFIRPSSDSLIWDGAHALGRRQW